MPALSGPVRVVIRLPYNRPEEPVPEPPLVDWNSEKEQILWEVIAKSRAIEGAATDWKGLAAHLQVPLPYLLHRAQTRYEEDLRGLQGINANLTPAIPSLASNAANEYFPRLVELPRLATLNATAPRHMGVRARLSSLGHNQRSPVATRSTKKVSSSSTLTLQGPWRPHNSARPLSPTASRAEFSGEDEESGSDGDEYTRREEEEDRRAEAQSALEKKLRDLQLALTKDALGLVSSPTAASVSMTSTGMRDRGRMRPLSGSTASASASMTSVQLNAARSPSHHSLSSTSSPQGSIPSIPSPPAQMPVRQQTRPLQMAQLVRARSPPAVSPTYARVLNRGGNGGRVSEQGSEASSFSDISDASLPASVLESELMSNGGAGSRYSSIRSNLAGRRPGGGVRM